MTQPLAPHSAPLERGRGGRVDGELKTTGQMQYTADIALDGMLYAAVVRSPYPHARITAIDTAVAARMPGVHCVLTGAEVGDRRYGRRIIDVPILAVDKARFLGEKVAAVAAETRAQAEAAAAAIQVAYEPLPPVFDPEQALALGPQAARDPQAPQDPQDPQAPPPVHPAPWEYEGSLAEPGGPPNLQARHVWSGGGDVEAALAAADLVVTERFTTPASHQGYLEPHACIAQVGPDGRVRIWATHKAPYNLRDQMARLLNVPGDQVEVVALAVGGDFGGKGSPMDVPLCIELARRTGRPVRLAMRYAEELQAGNPRHPAIITVRAGVNRDGRLAAMDIRAVVNVGAYAGFRPGEFLHGFEEAAAWYRIPALRVESLCVYTNQVQGGHKRAPGAPQATFAVESTVDMLAERLGLDPVEMRRRNLLRTGDATPLGKRWPDARGVDTLAAAVAAYRPAFPADVPPTVRLGRGVAVYCRPGFGGGTSLRLTADTAGGLLAELATPETGTGSHTVVRKLVSEGLGLDPEQVAVRYASTAQLPNDDGAGGSRVTAMIAEAARLAVADFRVHLLDRAAAAWQTSAAALELGAGGTVTDPATGRRLTLGELAAAEGDGALSTMTELKREARDPKNGALAFCVQMAQVGVDVETGQVHVYEILTVHDVATVLNPRSHRVQIEGGIAHGLGEALLEDLELRDGKTEAAHLGDYKLPSMRDLPPVRVVYLPGGRGIGATNVKGIGEMSNPAVPAAIANAVADAVGVRFTELPITAEKVYAALRARDGGRA